MTWIMHWNCKEKIYVDLLGSFKGWPRCNSLDLFQFCQSMSPYISLEAPSLKLFSSSAEVVKIFQPLKAITSKNVKKKKGTGWFFGDISNQRDLVQTFFPIKENVASEMEYSLAWISNPDVESCQIATETIKIEKNDQGLTQISAVSVTERQNHLSTPNIKYALSTRLINLNLVLVASSLPSTPRKRRKESPRTRLSLTSGAPFHSTPIFSRPQNTNSDWAIVSFSYRLFTSLTIWFLTIISQ